MATTATASATNIRSFGAEVRQRRQQLGLTREQLAHQVSCAAVTIYKIETNERRPSLQLARLLARALGWSASEAEALVAKYRQKVAAEKVPD